MSKKKIIAIVSIIVLLFAAGISVGVFLYGKGESSAVDGSQVQGTTDQNQPGEGNQSIETTPADGNVQETNPNEEDDNIQAPGEGNVDGEEDNENVENNNAANNNNQAAGNANNEVTTDTNVNNVGETTITRVEEQERLVSEAFWDWWMPMDVKLTRSNVNVNLPQITVEKRALTPVAGNDFVYAGQEITYVIDVTNNSDVDVEEIEITDKIPENTTFVSMEDIMISEVEGVEGTTVIVENEVVGVKWIATIPAKETVSAYFTVKVNEEAIGTILNVAIANGEESKDPTNTPEEGTETKTAIITSNKSSVITRNGEEVETAKIGDLITYTIQVTNTGDKEGITYITDEIPEGTKFVSVEDETAIFDEESDMIIWPLTVQHGETVEKRFTVEVIELSQTINNIAYIGENQTNKDIVETADIDIEKVATLVNDKEITETTKVRLGDIITYTITVENTGTATLTNVIVKDELVEFEETIFSLASGEIKEYEVTYTVTQEDIDLLTEITNITTVTSDQEAEDEDTDNTIVVNPDIEDITGNKTWITPVEDVNTLVATIELYQDGVKIKEATVTGNASYEFTNLPKYNETTGAESVYEVKEVAVEGYTTVQNGTNFTNTIEQDKVEVNGTKTWVAPEGTTHPTITINLLRDGVEVDSKELENGTTEYSFTNLDKYDLNDGHIYSYTVTEDVVEGYTTVQEGNNFTNTINQAKVEVSGTKTWIDPEGTEHPTITINLLRDGEKVDSAELTNGTTTYSFTNLDKYDLTDGHIYSYTVTEDAVQGYTIAQNGTNFTNTINQEKVEVSGTKTWVDPEGTTHPTITINLLRDGIEVESKELANGTTEYSFTNLDKYDLNDGHIYSYTVTEDVVEGYTTVQEGNNFTNTINQAKVEVSGTKTWIDPEGTTHPTITINLLRDGEKVDSAELTNGTTTYSFTNLDKYDLEDGHIYSYTVTEDIVQGYTTAQNGTNFTNTIIDPSNIIVTGTKTWIDGGRIHNNAEEIIITLTRTANGKTETVSATPEWNGNTYTFNGLENYDDEGYVYTYSVSETQVSGYDMPVQEGNNFTNTITDLSDVTVTGTKTWVDGGKEHNNANEITLTLTRTSAKQDSTAETVEVTPTWNGNTYTFSNLERYDDEGYEYTYTVTETQVDGYNVPTYKGYSITNTITDLGDVEVEGTKTWVDGGKLHNNAEEITLTLSRTANGKTETVEVKPTWTENTYKFSNLERYDEQGYEYTYSVSETKVNGYDAPVQDGNNFTNSITDLGDKTITGTKTWIDGGRKHKNAEEITLTLSRTANGKTETVSAKPEWNGNTYTFSKLEYYDAEGYEYTYTVTETQVSGYDVPVQDGNNFTNIITDPANVTISGTKTWVDDGRTHNNEKEITLTLTRTANGKTETVEILPTWNGNTYTFNGLEKYDAQGYEYSYAVTEGKVGGYESTVSADGKHFTNTIIDPEDVQISGEKIWVDPEDSVHGEITLQVYQNGKPYTIKNDKGEDVPYGITLNSTTRSFNIGSLPKYKVDSEGKYILKDGKVQLNEYTVVETKGQSGYKVSYSDATIDANGNYKQNVINTIENTEISIQVNKVWVDEGVSTNRPTITVKLYMNESAYKTATIAKTASSCIFTELPKYTFGTDANGKATCIENTYRVEEVSVAGYVTNNGTLDMTKTPWTQTITNTVDPTAKTSVTVNKVWNAPNITEHPDITINLYKNGDETTTFRTTTLSSGTDKVWQATELQYTFNDLPKYQVDGEGKHILDGNGNVQLNTYTVKEVELPTYKAIYNGNTITNMAKGILQVTSVTTTATEHKVPADVVFVLDISGSMCKQNTQGNSRAKDMVAAVNSAISTVMANNSNSRVAVVTYSTTAISNGYSWNNYNNATTILPLGTYSPKSGSTNYLTCSQGSGKWDDGVYTYSNVSISTNVQGVNTTTVQVTGGTYTQGGIAQGANILANASTQYDADGANGPIEPVTRTPILLVLSDGEPTVYTTNYNNVGEIQYGNGSDTTENEAYYTIRTAVAYKNKIKANYGTANMYTIGFGADTLLLRTILNPNTTNITSCYNTSKNTYTKKLYNKLAATTEGANGFSYADGSYTTGSITAEELATLLNKFINLSQPQNSYRVFTAEELTNKRIDLGNIDVEETSKITNFISFGSTTYTFEQAKDIGVGIVKEVTNADSSKSYYVDLSVINTTEQISIKYQTLPVQE